MNTIRRMMDHLYWANRELLHAIEESKGANKEIYKLCRHIFIAEQVWLLRLEGKNSSNVNLWAEDADIDALLKLNQTNEQQYKRYVRELSEHRLDDMIAYLNLSGASFQTSIRDILIHVALHGQYHRGQINRALREEGAGPAVLDYILYTRMEDL